jgi:hypothetical protein
MAGSQVLAELRCVPVSVCISALLRVSDSELEPTTESPAEFRPEFIDWVGVLGGDINRLRLGRVSDSGGPIGVDLGERAQKQATDVGKNGSAAGRNAVLGQELVEVHEGKVDALRSLEKLEIRGQVVVVIGGFHLSLFGAVLRTEAGVCVGD